MTNSEMDVTSLKPRFEEYGEVGRGVSVDEM